MRQCLYIGYNRARGESPNEAVFVVASIKGSSTYKNPGNLLEPVPGFDQLTKAPFEPLKEACVSFDLL